MSYGVVQVIIDESSPRSINGIYEFERDNGGVLIIPSGISFPGSPEPKELFWRTDENKLYRRNDGDTAWDAVQGDLVDHASTHQDGGGDEISIAGLSGLLADPQTPISHTHTESDVTDLNHYDSTDFSTDHGALTGTCPQDPQIHNSSHKHNGSDEVATATPSANAIPKADSSGKLAEGWIPTTATVVPSEVFATNESAGGQIIGNWPPSDITFDDEYTNSDATVFDWDTVGNVELEILKAGKVQIIAQVGFHKTSGNGRVIMAGFLVYKPSGGSWGNLWGSKGLCYLRNNTDGDQASFVCQGTLEVNAGDKLKVIAWRDDGSGTQVIREDATSLSCVWFSN